jgi:hypothetical protein
MTVYAKCHCCGKTIPFKAAVISQEYDDIEDVKDENILCTDCYSDKQDAWAYNDSEGEFRSYEDHMRYNYGYYMWRLRYT